MSAYRPSTFLRRHRVGEVGLFLVLALWAFACSSPPLSGGTEPTIETVASETSYPAFAAIDDVAAKIGPAGDGWDTEVLSAAVESQLERIAAWIETGVTDGAEELVDAHVKGEALSPGGLVTRFNDGLLTVRTASSGRAATATFADDTGFLAAVGDLAARLDGFADRRADFNLFRIELQDESFSTRAYFEASGQGPSASRQIDSVWVCRWALPEGSLPPKLLFVKVTEYEETQIEIDGGVLFQDVTRSALGHNPSYHDQLLQTPEHWLSRLTKDQGFSKQGWQGISIADVNGDGLEDLFLPQQGGLPNRLYVQRPDGTFDDRSADSGVDFLERTLAGLFVDLDNDGDPDLVLAHRPAVLVLENDGTGHFRNIRFIAGLIPDSHSLSAADYDLDGDLDLYICAYRRAPHERGIASPMPYHDANNGGTNALLRNDGDFRFTDVTVKVGLDANNRRFSLAAAWEDFDNDGDLDLYVANDYGRNNLYRNDGVAADGEVRFTDVAAATGVEDISSGMSVSWADYNRDGLMDLYVGNMFSAAGNRITYQRKFERDREATGPLADVQRMARGNSLFENSRGGRDFVDRSEEAGVVMGRWAWSSIFADLNNDGWEDLVVANGNLTQTNPDDL